MSKRIDLIRSCCKASDLSEDTLENIIATAYYLGREEATQKIIREHNKMIIDMRQRARECSFPHLAEGVIGTSKDTFIYSPDYTGDKTKKYSDIEVNCME